jgi:hypothetical protein
LDYANTKAEIQEGLLIQHLFYQIFFIGKVLVKEGDSFDVGES